MNRTLLGFFRKELTSALRDRRMRILLLAVPIVEMIIFGVAISNEIKNVRLAVFAPPGDRITEHVYQRCIASGWFLPVRGVDPYHLVQADLADAVIVAPPRGAASNFGRKNGDGLQLLVNATNVVRAQYIESYVRATLENVLREDGWMSNANPPLTFQVRVLYNESGKTSLYMVPGVICMVLCIITVMLTSMSMAKEKEAGTIETLLSAPIKTWEIMVGKTAPAVLLGLADMPFLMLVANVFFGVPVRGHFWVLFVATLAFLFATVSIGFLISTICKTQQQAMMAGFLFLFPAVMLSGMIYPIENMPQSIKFIAYLNPIKYFVSLLRNILLKGGGTEFVCLQISGLLAIASVCMTVSFRRFKAVFAVE